MGLPELNHIHRLGNSPEINQKWLCQLNFLAISEWWCWKRDSSFEHDLFSQSVTI
ncbi:hypothetical protein VRK_28310 [Vibrio sp. MEBiC08052]|nr:hypothetical protein VRK_28310 [Vibrio sp. MEBiC08052]